MQQALDKFSMISIFDFFNVVPRMAICGRKGDASCGVNTHRLADWEKKLSEILIVVVRI